METLHDVVKHMTPHVSPTVCVSLGFLVHSSCLTALLLLLIPQVTRATQIPLAKVLALWPQFVSESSSKQPQSDTVKDPVSSVTHSRSLSGALELMLVKWFLESS